MCRIQGSRDGRGTGQVLPMRPAIHLGVFTREEMWCSDFGGLIQLSRVEIFLCLHAAMGMRRYLEHEAGARTT